MQHESIDGVVVRVRDYGENDRYLSVLTAKKGRITMLSKGGRSFKGSQTAISQLYTYGNFEYYRKGNFFILKGGTPIQPFYSLSMDIDRLDLAFYLCDIICEVTDEGAEAGEELRLLLNTLYAVSKNLYPQEIIKGAFELRIAALSGYEPELNVCSQCNKSDAKSFYLNVMNGSLHCSDCQNKLSKNGVRNLSPIYDDIREAKVMCMLSPAVCAAMRYCLNAPLERLFAFDLTDEADLLGFAKITETYLLSHLGRGFDSLNFYHTMRSPQKKV